MMNSINNSTKAVTNYDVLASTARRWHVQDQIELIDDKHFAINNHVFVIQTTEYIRKYEDKWYFERLENLFHNNMEENEMKENNNTNALVDEVLTKVQVRELISMADVNNPNWKYDDHISIFKGWFESWCGTRYDGYIVLHVHKEATPETTNDFMPTYVEHNDYYFMEVEKELVDTSLSGYTYAVKYHALMPITPQYVPVKRMWNGEGNAKDLCDYIVSSACRDKWDYYKVPMTEQEIVKSKKNRDFNYYAKDYTKLVPLTHGDIDYWYEPLTDNDKKRLEQEKQDKETTLITRFTTGELPPIDDDAWYSILSMGYGTEGYDLECKIIKILRNRGFSVQIDGERDSFGWVTRGIWVDGKVMCLY